eukprot:scaffold313410_cov18-Tisochrysis_lutea.AAC.1
MGWEWRNREHWIKGRMDVHAGTGRAILLSLFCFVSHPSGQLRRCLGPKVLPLFGLFPRLTVFHDLGCWHCRWLLAIQGMSLFPCRQNVDVPYGHASVIGKTWDCKGSGGKLVNVHKMQPMHPKVLTLCPGPPLRSSCFLHVVSTMKAQGVTNCCHIPSQVMRLKKVTEVTEAMPDKHKQEFAARQRKSPGPAWLAYLSKDFKRILK